MKIMVVDQYDSVRDKIIHVLMCEPDLEIVGDGKIGPEMVEQALLCRPDIVLMDSKLFEASGRESIRCILTECPETAFIILASIDDVELLLDALRNGAKGYLPKNISEAVLLRSLYAVERGELAISKSMMATVVSELRKILQAIIASEENGISPLTYRELDILRLLATGASNQEIAQQLPIPNNKVVVHVHQDLSGKAHLRNRRRTANVTQLVEHGFLKKKNESTNPR